MMTRLILISLLFIASISYAQKKYVLSLTNIESSYLNKYQGKNFKSKSGLESFIMKKRLKLISDGHVLANVDSLIWKQDTAKVSIYEGPIFEELSVQIDESDEQIIRRIPGVNERMLSRVDFTAKEVGGVIKKINEYLIENGYPFSSVRLEVDQVKSPITEATLIIDEGPQVSVKEVHIKGSTTISKKFILNAIAIKEGDLYTQSRLNDIRSRINQIQFLSEIKPHELLFTKDGVEIFLYLESNPVSLVNGIVGLQPDPVTEKNIVTGDVRLKLQNVLNRGELFRVNWRSLQPTTQDLDLQLTFPFLFNTPFGIDSKFDLYKQDSSFLTTNLNAGIQYFLKGGNYIKAFYESDNSNVLSGGTNSLENYASVSTNRYGLGVFRQQFDYLPNPSRGLKVSMEVSAGQRSSSLSSSDTISKTTTFKSDFEVEAFVPLAKRHVLRIANVTRTYYAPEVYKNEEFRFGGLQTQRGFNEEVLRATTLSTFSFEYRFLVDRNSHAFAFFDQSFYENTVNGYSQDEPFGFGAGFSFGTNIGIFSISYALGQQFDNPILLRDGKVHFGYVAYF
jgi:outer membrane protein assembly factor BamA